MPRPRSLPVLITVDVDGTATAVYALPQDDEDQEQPLFRFASLEKLLHEHDLDHDEVEELRPLAIFPLSALLVDDAVDVDELVRGALHDAGYRTTIVATLDGARAHLGRANPAVVLLDLRVGHDAGEELLLELADAPHAPPTVLLSARRDGHHVATRYGVPFLARPFAIDELLRAIEAAIRDGRRPTRP